MKIKEVIVVEGKNDSNTLKSYFDCDTIETHGTCLSEFTINLIETINKTRGIIVFTDPDSPGDYIRNTLNNRISNLKHAYILKEDAKTSKKVGIEHASKETLEKALKNLITYNNIKGDISMSDMYDLGLCGFRDSKEKREKIGRTLNLGKANAKTLLTRLNMLGISLEKLKEVLG